MDRRNLVLNTLIYADQIKAGQMTQADCLAKADAFGIGRLEVRRELLGSTLSGAEPDPEELGALRRQAVGRGIELFYSVPEGLSQVDQVNPDAVLHLAEAAALGATHVKWNVGRFDARCDGLAAFVASGVAAGLQLGIENDQTAAGGEPEAVAAMLEFCERGGIDLGLTFDVGNWRIRGHDPAAVAPRLRRWVRYIHLKDVAVAAGDPPGLAVVPVGQGSLDMTAILAALPTGLPVAYEFRVASDSVLADAIDHLFGQPFAAHARISTQAGQIEDGGNPCSGHTASSPL
ncbi:MAG: sugar phosphate isomerase/epimerase [Bifidobacteriaceae bacterium]|jgi:sugar phosphate isomerase/epimerase|nr:sugar phosphate isomerase/epimerase [Bifidobacteriaceae bacterium]